VLSFLDRGRRRKKISNTPLTFTAKIGYVFARTSDEFEIYIDEFEIYM